MTNKFGKKNLIQIAVCVALIIAFALPTGMMLKKATLSSSELEAGTVVVENENLAGQEVALVQTDSTESNENQTEASEIADEIQQEPVVQISMVEDGVYRGTAVSADVQEITIQTNNLAMVQDNSGVIANDSLSESNIEDNSADASQKAEEKDAESQTEDADEAESGIVLLSFDDETIVKRIDGVVEKEEVKEEPKKENTLKLTGISQSDNVAKKSKDLVCKYNPLMDITLSDEEYEILCRIVEAEAGDQDIYGRILVANVILNRTQYWEFPDTVKGVVFQVNSKGAVQFSPIADGSFYRVTISKKTRKAVNSALRGDDYSDGALYFFMRSATSASKSAWFDSLDFIMKYGCHEFFK